MQSFNTDRNVGVESPVSYLEISNEWIQSTLLASNRVHNEVVADDRSATSEKQHPSIWSLFSLLQKKAANNNFINTQIMLSLQKRTVP